MHGFTIYCTEEQTKTALELGAPLHIIEATTETQIRAINTIANGRHKEEYTLVDNSLINNPTAEQMIGWLEEKDEIQEFDIAIWEDPLWASIVHLKNKPAIILKKTYKTRKEATIAAIDAALEYLTNNKK